MNGHEFALSIVPLIRPAYLPEYEPITEPDAHRTATRVGGTPFLPEGMRRPKHPDGDELVFALQYRLEELPVSIGPHEAGLLQLFARHYDRFDAGTAQEPETEELRWRLVAPQRLGEPEAAHAEGGTPSLEPRRVETWRRVGDWPGRDFSELMAQHLDVEEIEFDLLDAYMNNQAMHYGEKLGGYPTFSQEAEPPECLGCGAEMPFSFQLNEHGREVWWQYDSTMHVFACGTCPQQFRSIFN